MAHEDEDCDGGRPRCVFAPLPAPKGWAFADAYVASCLKKWDLARGTRVARLRYNKPFHKMHPEPFLKDLFADPTVAEQLEVLASDGEWRRPGPVSGVQFEHVPATTTSMAFFGRLEEAEPPIVRASTGAISQCIDQVVDGITVSDLLREMVLVEESENYELYSAAERKELLFRVMAHLCVGGSMCQWEDKAAPLLDAVKAVYKALLTVAQRDNRIEVASNVYAVTGVTGAKDGWELFPGASPQNFMYVCVDPTRRHVNIWYHAFRSWWG